MRTSGAAFVQVIIVLASVCIPFAYAVWKGNGITDVRIDNLPLSIVNSNFIYEGQDGWPGIHIITPFNVYMITQDTMLTMVLFWSWETIEVAMVLLGKGYVLYFGDASSLNAEPPADSLVGDVGNGFLGMFLGHLVVIAWKIPSWTPSPWGPYRRIWVNRFLQLVIVLVPFTLVNINVYPKNSPPVHLGIMGCMAWLLFTWHLFRRWNWNAEEIQLYWKRKPTDTDFRAAYAAWFCTALFILSFGLYYITYGYFQFWFAWALAYSFHLGVLIAQGRAWEWWYMITFGFSRRQLYHQGQTEITVDRDVPRVDEFSHES